ncbi:MAG: hypothetical protein IJ121_10635 [Eubacterium sp.]|nr:hypothetical protein [Eubacterium sp.]
MDKAEYQAKLEELTSYVRDRDYESALNIVNEVDWKRVKSVQTLSMVADVYEANRQFDDAKRILKISLERSPGSRTVLAQLTEVSIRLGEIDDAEDYYARFMEVAGNDNAQYLLHYKLLKARRAPLSEQIAVLREYREREYTEEWAFELASLYAKAGDEKRCVEECDDMVLWFGTGKYVLRALELKMKYEGLTPAQRKLYNEELVRDTQTITPQITEPYPAPVKAAAPEPDDEQDEMKGKLRESFQEVFQGIRREPPREESHHVSKTDNTLSLEDLHISDLEPEHTDSTPTEPDYSAETIVSLPDPKPEKEPEEPEPEEEKVWTDIGLPVRKTEEDIAAEKVAQFDLDSLLQETAGTFSQEISTGAYEKTTDEDMLSAIPDLESEEELEFSRKTPYDSGNIFGMPEQTDSASVDAAGSADVQELTKEQEENAEAAVQAFEAALNQTDDGLPAEADADVSDEAVPEAADVSEMAADLAEPDGAGNAGFAEMPENPAGAGDTGFAEMPADQDRSGAPGAAVMPADLAEETDAEQPDEPAAAAGMIESETGDQVVLPEEIAGDMPEDDTEESEEIESAETESAETESAETESAAKGSSGSRYEEAESVVGGIFRRLFGRGPKAAESERSRAAEQQDEPEEADEMAGTSEEAAEAAAEMTGFSEEAAAVPEMPEAAMPETGTEAAEMAAIEDNRIPEEPDQAETDGDRMRDTEEFVKTDLGTAVQDADTGAEPVKQRSAFAESIRRAVETREAERRQRLAEEEKRRQEEERLAKEEAERQAKEEAERLAREAEARALREKEERRRREEEERLARIEAERREKEEEERRIREEEERKAREEAERLAREEEERKAREEAERLAREEEERKAAEEAERLAREEAERKAAEEAERLAREEEERKAAEEAERLAREEAERKAAEEAERLAREEAEQKAREEAEQKAREDAEQKAREEAEQEAREAAEQTAEAYATEELPADEFQEAVDFTLDTEDLQAIKDALAAETAGEESARVPEEVTPAEEAALAEAIAAFEQQNPDTKISEDAAEAVEAAEETAVEETEMVPEADEQEAEAAAEAETAAEAEPAADAEQQDAAEEADTSEQPKKKPLYNEELEVPDPEPTEKEKLSHSRTLDLSKVGENTVPVSLDEIISSETPEERRIRILHNEEQLRMNDEQRRIFTYFARIPGMDHQILSAMSAVYQHADEKTSTHGNLAIMGAQGSGKSKLAQNMISAMCLDLGMEAAKIARVTGYVLNRKDPAEIVRKMAGGFLIIEECSEMEEETVQKLGTAMDFRTDRMILILEDEKSAMRGFLRKNPEFSKRIEKVISIPIFTNDELISFARTYAEENGCRLDDMAVLALYTIIGNDQSYESPMTISKVKTMVDEAITSARKGPKRGRRGRRRGKEDLLIIHEKDFEGN